MMIKYWILVLALINIAHFNCILAEEDYPEDGGATAEVEEDGGVTANPAQTVAKALQCFNNNFIYNSCEESYRLTETGTLNIPHEYTDQYCSGPCQTETHLVLDCIGNSFFHFEFYNKATIEDVKDTIEAGCGYGSQRGNFNVARHLEYEEGNANKKTIHVVIVLMLILFGQCLLF